MSSRVCQQNLKADVHHRDDAAITIAMYVGVWGREAKQEGLRITKKRH